MEFDKESQQRILRIAADKNEGRPVEELDEKIANILDLHPEFNPIWEEGELALVPREVNGQIVNPFVHTVLHVIVDQQIQMGSPEFVYGAFKRLTGQGMDPHDSLHAIIGVYADLYFTSMRRGARFDSLDYQTRVDSLSFKEQE